MGFAYRCTDKTHCGRRKSLKRSIEKYLYRPKCPGCKQDRLKYDPSVYRQSLKRGCFCRGNRWPHNRGRIEDENHVCMHADVAEAHSIFLARDMDARTSVINSGDPCPF